MNFKGFFVSQENSTVDNIVKFLIQQKKIGLGYNVIYTVLNKVHYYIISLDPFCFIEP